MKLIRRNILRESDDIILFFPNSEVDVRVTFHTGIRRGLDNVWRRAGDGEEVEFSSDNWSFPGVEFVQDHLYWLIERNYEFDEDYEYIKKQTTTSFLDQRDVLAFIICEY